MGHKLDRVYCSRPLYNNIKTVKSSIKSKHDKIIARGDMINIFDSNKTSKTVFIRKRTPSDDYRALMLIRDIDWGPLYSCVTVQPAFDIFYSHLEKIISMVFPLKSVTLTSRDPPYITPRIKYLLRKQNRLMRQGRLELAGLHL